MDATDSTSPAGGRERWLAVGGLVLLFAILIGLFQPAMNAPLAFDDMLSIKQVQQFDHWTDAFRSDPFSLYRPVKNLFFYAMLQTSGDALNFHLSTVIAYLLATAGVFTLALRLIGHPLWGLAVAAVWSLSAANVTIAIWASCFNISLAIAAMTFGLAAWDCWREDPKRWGYAIAFGLLLVIGFLSYETAIAVAPMAVMIDLYRGRKVFTKASVVRYAGIAVAVLAFLALRHTAGGKLAGNINPSFAGDIERWQIAASAPYFLWTHFLMWVAPWGRLECLGSYLWDQSIPAVIVPFCWLFLIGIAVLAIRFWRPGNLVVLGLACFFIGSIPSGNFIPIGNTPYADYYVPIPAIGLALMLVAMIRGLIRLSNQKRIEPAARNLAWVIIIVLIGARAANLTAFRNWVNAWENPAVVMAETAAARPYQFLAKAAVSRILLEAGEIDLAREYASASIKDIDDLAVPHVVLGHVHFRAGEFELADASFRAALDRRHMSNETILDSHLKLGEIMARDPAKVQQAFDQHFLLVLQQRDYLKHPDAVIATAEAFRNAGRLEDELATLKKGADYHPDHPAIKSALEAADRRQSADAGES
ncbi:MAG: hypothetical protein AAGI48_13200 [Verrucomicrobiota bacterium]